MKILSICLTEEILKWLRKKKEETGASISEIIRRILQKEKEIKK